MPCHAMAEYAFFKNLYATEGTWFPNNFLKIIVTPAVHEEV